MKEQLLPLFALLLIIVQPSTYIISQQFFTEGFSDNDFTAWNPNGASLPTMKFSNCSSHRIFGGYNVFIGDPTTPVNIYRTFTNLIPHYSVTITANFYKIDSWVNNTIFFMVDGVTAKLYTFTAANGGTTDFCGNPTPVTDTINTSFNDLIVPVSFTVSHSASTLTVKIISNLVGSAGSWGIRDFNITLEACDQSCLTCSSGTSCTSCDASQGLTLSGSFCVCSNTTKIRQKYIPCSAIPCAVCLNSLPCSNGYYLSGTTTYCEPCNIACGTCTTPLNSGVTCPTCNSAGFIRPSPGAACSSCFSGCLTCSSTAANTCSACKYGYFRDSGNQTCVITCPAGTYSEQTSASCLPCSTPCSTCIGFNGVNYYCTSCISTRFLYNFNCYITCPYSLLGYQGNCIATCPSGTYADGGTLTCLSCISNCIECTNGTGCFICATGAYMYNGICYITCPATYYGDNQTQLCLSCHYSCLTCNGPFSDNCLSCNTSAIALISNVCYTVCPNNTYSALCSLCNSSCLTCNGPNSTNCLSCVSPLFFHTNFTSCLASCNPGQISNNYNFTCTQCPYGYVAYFEACQPCSPTCLTCDGITFLECTTCISGTILASKTCVLTSEGKVIYMPNKPRSLNILNVFMVFFFINISLCLILQALFQYKTNLLLLIELMQILSYTQFLTIQLSQSSQKFAHFLYYTNFAAFITPITVSPHPSVPPKFQLIGKTGVFLSDAFGIQLIVIVCCILFLGTKYLSQRSQFFKKIYKKINPYIITYTFRLLLLELSLDIMLYLYCFDATSGIGIGSLVMLLIDLCCVVSTLCWRIKTEQDGTQMALFYYNEIGQKEPQQKYLPEEENLGTSIQEKIRKSKILPSLMELILKVPIPITIIYFIGNSSTQTICFFIYFAFFLLLVTIVPVRRKVYRLMMIMSSAFLMLNALGGILVSKGVSSTYFDGVWLTIIIVLFLLTLFQIISNYHYFVSCFSYIKYSLKHGFKSTESGLPNNDSNANLTEQDDQSVVFERVQPQGNKKYSKNQSKILTKNQLNSSWMQQKY